MLPIRSVINRIRVAVHDAEQRINYTDEEILAVINAGLRIIRRTIADVQPEILMRTTTGLLEAGETEIALKRRPMFIVKVTAGDKVISKVEGVANNPVYHNYTKVYGCPTLICSKYEIKNFAEHKLNETNLQHIANQYQIGCPKLFYRTGLQSLKVYPIPHLQTAFTVRTIDDFEEVTINDTTHQLNEFDDFLIEYAIWRLSLGDEFDMTQEQQIIGNIHNQIARVLSPPPMGVVTRGYW